MAFPHSLENIHQNYTQIVPQEVEGVDLLISKLLKTNGSFPTSKSYCEHLLRLVRLEDMSIDKVAENLYLDPIASIRLLILANNTMYSSSDSAKGIEELLPRIGMLRIPETLEDLASLRNLNIAFQGRALACVDFQNIILRRVLFDKIYPLFIKDRIKNWHYRQLLYVRSLVSFGLAYTKPNLSSACELDALAGENSTYERSFRKIFSISYVNLTKSVIKHLHIPKEFEELQDAQTVAPWNRKSWNVKNGEHLKKPVSALYLVEKIADCIINFKDSHHISSILREFEGKRNLKRNLVEDALVGVSSRYFDQVKSLGLEPYRLPSFLSSYDEKIVDADGQVKIDSRNWPIISTLLKNFILELKACLQTVPGENDFYRLPQAVNITLKTLVRAIGFDRATLYRVHDNKTLVPMVNFGRDPQQADNKTLSIISLPEYSPMKAVLEKKRISYEGDPIFSEDWPFVAFPVIWNNEVQAVFYADKKQTKNANPLSIEEQVSTMALAEEWSNVPANFY